MDERALVYWLLPYESFPMDTEFQARGGGGGGVADSSCVDEPS